MPNESTNEPHTSLMERRRAEYENSRLRGRGLSRESSRSMSPISRSRMSASHGDATSRSMSTTRQATADNSRAQLGRRASSSYGRVQPGAQSQGNIRHRQHASQPDEVATLAIQGTFVLDTSAPSLLTSSGLNVLDNPNALQMYAGRQTDRCIKRAMAGASNLTDDEPNTVGKVEGKQKIQEATATDAISSLAFIFPGTDVDVEGESGTGSKGLLGTVDVQAEFSKDLEPSTSPLLANPFTVLAGQQTGKLEAAPEGSSTSTQVAGQGQDLQNLMNKGKEAVVSSLHGLQSDAKQLMDAVGSVAKKTAEPLTAGIQQSKQVIAQSAQHIKTLNSNVEDAVDKGISKVLNLAEEKSQQTPSLVDASVKKLHEILDEQKGKSQAALKNAQLMLEGNVQGMQGGLMKLDEGCKNTMKNLDQTVKTVQTVLNAQVRNTQAALNTGIENTQAALDTGIKSTQRAVESGIKSTQTTLDAGLQNTQTTVVTGWKNTQQALDNGVKHAQQAFDDKSKKLEANVTSTLQYASDTRMKEAQVAFQEGIGNIQAGLAAVHSSLDSGVKKLQDVPKDVSSQIHQVHMNVRNIMEGAKQHLAEHVERAASASAEASQSSKKNYLKRNTRERQGHKPSSDVKVQANHSAGVGVLPPMLLDPNQVADNLTTAVKRIAGVKPENIVPEGGLQVSMTANEFEKKDKKNWTQTTPAMLNVAVKAKKHGGVNDTAKRVLPAIAGAVLSAGTSELNTNSSKNILQMSEDRFPIAMIPAEVPAQRLPTNASLNSSSKELIACQGSGKLMIGSSGAVSASALAANAMAGDLASALPTDPLSKNAPILQLARAELEEEERKRKAAERIKKAWKQAEERALQASLRQAAHDIIRRHLVAKVTRIRFKKLRQATITCQSLYRGKLARKRYSEIWMQIAIKEGVGYLLGLRKAKFDIYFGFARREAAFAVQSKWRALLVQRKMRVIREQVSKERMGVLFDLWDQTGTPLVYRRKCFERIQDLGVGSLRSLAAFRASVLETANMLPEQHLKAAAARQMFTFDRKYYMGLDTFPGDALSQQPEVHRLTPDELERRHNSLRRERLEIYMQLKELPARDIRMLYWEWGIPLTEKSRMQNLVMHKLWLDPSFADKSEQLMRVVETLPEANLPASRRFTVSASSSQPHNYSHAMSMKGTSGKDGNPSNPKQNSSIDMDTQSVMSAGDAWETESAYSRASSIVDEDGIRFQRRWKTRWTSFGRERKPRSKQGNPQLDSLDAVSVDMAFDFSDTHSVSSLAAAEHRNEPQRTKPKERKSGWSLMSCGGSTFKE